jgi:cyclopropane fatty-acyl-phospholipid synthase-like methyltransferase
MTESPSTEAVYDGQAHRWARQEATLLSDFTARPRVLHALGDLAGAHVLDLGCGEGYVSNTEPAPPPCSASTSPPR